MNGWTIGLVAIGEVVDPDSQVAIGDEIGTFVWPSCSAEGSATEVAEVMVRPDGTLCGRLLLDTIVSDGHPVLDSVTSVHDCVVTRAG